LNSRYFYISVDSTKLYIWNKYLGLELCNQNIGLEIIFLLMNSAETLAYTVDEKFCKVD